MRSFRIYLFSNVYMFHAAVLTVVITLYVTLQYFPTL